MNLFRSIDANAPVAPTYAARPDAVLGPLRLIHPEGYSKGNLLELAFKARSNRFTGQAQYTLGKSYNNTQSITWFPAYSYTPATIGATPITTAGKCEPGGKADRP